MSKATSTGVLPLFTEPETVGSKSAGATKLPRTRKSAHVSRRLPDWRRKELAEKYAPRDAYEPDEVEE
jgi:hypothetical protein